MGTGSKCSDDASKCLNGGGNVPNGGIKRLDGGGNVPNGGSTCMDGGGNVPNGGSKRLDGGSNVPNGGSKWLDGGSNVPNGGNKCPAAEVTSWTSQATSPGCKNPPQEQTDTTRQHRAGRARFRYVSRAPFRRWRKLFVIPNP